jgi:cytochrome c
LKILVFEEFGMLRVDLFIGIFLMASTSVAVTPLALAQDVARGAKLYKECEGCHGTTKVLATSSDQKMGPPHCGVVGRKAGTVEGFPYSDVMREAGFVWDDKHLHEFLTFPISYLPGTNMGYAGMYDENDRNDVIAFLKAERALTSPACQESGGDASSVPKKTVKPN